MNTVPRLTAKQAGPSFPRVSSRAATPAEPVRTPPLLETDTFETQRARPKAEAGDGGSTQPTCDSPAMAPSPISSMRPFHSHPNKSLAFDGGIKWSS
ncbi:MAG: hypothetical protein ABW110_22750 [Steroidobacteraceae bacterium]